MTRRQYSNTATQATLTGGIAAADTSFTLTSFAGFPTVPFTATISRGEVDEEVVLITAVSSSTVTATRGYDGTTAKSHAAGATFTHTTVAQDFDEANAHVNATTGAHGVTGSVVGTTDVQTLTNKTLNAPTLAGAVLTGTASGVNLTLSGTLGVTGATTLAALTATTGSFSGALTVSGVTTLAAMSATTGSFSGAVTASTAPSAGGHLVNKTYADALGTDLATASTIMRRDASGNTNVNKVTAAAAASASNDLMRKVEVDAADTALGLRIDGNLNNHGAIGTFVGSTPGATVELKIKTFRGVIATNSSGQGTLTFPGSAFPSATLAVVANVASADPIYWTVVSATTSSAVLQAYNGAVAVGALGITTTAIMVGF